MLNVFRPWPLVCFQPPMMADRQVQFCLSTKKSMRQPSLVYPEEKAMYRYSLVLAMCQKVYQQGSTKFLIGKGYIFPFPNLLVPNPLMKVRCPGQSRKAPGGMTVENPLHLGMAALKKLFVPISSCHCHPSEERHNAWEGTKC